MAGEVTEELKQEVLEFFQKKNKHMTVRDVAKGMKLDRKLVKDVVREMVNVGALEFVYEGGTTFIGLPGTAEHE